MEWGRVALVTVSYVVLGAALVSVMWPTERTGERFLRRWGLDDPSRQQAAVAAGYLRARRALYLLLFAVTPSAVAAVSGALGVPGPPSGFVRLLVPLAAALLLAEAVAAVRQVRGVRVAALARRTWHDLVPAWAVALLVGMAALALVLAGAGLAAQPWADRVAAALPPDDVPQPPDGDTVHLSDGFRVEITHPPGWLVVAATLLGLAAVLALVRLAVRRHAVADPDVDAVLRARTARVVVGVGFAWLADMVLLAANRLELLDSLPLGPERLPAPPPPGWLAGVQPLARYSGLALLLVAVVGWIRVTAPPRRSRDPHPVT